MIRNRFQSPVPYAQVAVLMLVRLAEPLSYTVIFPFINQMISELGVTDNPDSVGFYSGLVESVFAFVQFFTVYHWATLSDKIGRKPVILVGLVGSAISISLFGLTTNFWAMITVRSLSGALNGNVAVVKASLGDITDDSNSTDAFALYGLTWTVGAILGNTIGGYLSHPFERFPTLFGGWEIFHTHPYLLPCLCASFSTFAGILFAVLFYRESLPSRADQTFTLKLLSPTHKRSGSAASFVSETETLVDNPDERLLTKAVERGPWTFWELMRHRPVQILSVTMFLNQFVGGAWSAASLLFFYDKSNGLGLSASAIGTAFALNGLFSIAAQLLLLTRIRKWLGIARAYQVMSFGWILIWFILPLLRPLLEMVETPDESGHFPEQRGWIMSIAVNLLLSYMTIVGMANSLLMVLINYSAPDKTALGAVNGISTAIGCMSRVLGPSSVSALFAWSMEKKVLGGRLWWIFMVFMSSASWISCLFISHVEPTGQLDTIEEEEEPPEESWTFEGAAGKHAREAATV